jgi:hypothetical protein
VAIKSTSPDFSQYIIIWFDVLDVLLHQVKIAIIGITAGGVGLDFSSAQNVVFLELPQSPSLMLQVQHYSTIFLNLYITSSAICVIASIIFCNHFSSIEFL